MFPLSRTTADKVETGSVVSGLKEVAVLSVAKLEEAVVLKAVLPEKTGAGMAMVVTVKPATDSRLVPRNGLTNSGSSLLLICKF